MIAPIRTSSRCLIALTLLIGASLPAQKPSRIEVIEPIRLDSFDRNGATLERKHSGNPRRVNGFLAFDGAMDGNRQVDPQIAVGGEFVLHATNLGLVIYDKSGRYVKAIRQSGFNGGVDPKMFFDPHNRAGGKGATIIVRVPFVDR